MEEKEYQEIVALMGHLTEYNQRVGQMFEQTFELIRKDGKEPFLIEDVELLKYMKIRYKGVIDE